MVRVPENRPNGKTVEVRMVKYWRCPHGHRHICGKCKDDARAMKKVPKKERGDVGSYVVRTPGDLAKEVAKGGLNRLFGRR